MKYSVALIVVVLPLIAFVGLPLTTAAPPEEFSLKDLRPLDFSSRDPYRVDPYIVAASKLQKLGKDKAVEVLRAATMDRDHRHFDVRLIVLCRMLFTAKPDKDFRRPFLGGPSRVGETDWPLEPIEIVDGIPFLIAYGYILAGTAETPGSYLDYCLKECDWSTTAFTPKSDAEKNKALKQLLASPKWKRPPDDDDINYLSKQISPAD